MRPAQILTILPALPHALQQIVDVAHNLRWTWDHETISLFRRLDADLWEATGHNPVLMLGSIDQARLEAAASDEAFLAHYRRVCEGLDQYLGDRATWYQRAQRRDGLRIGYFSAEFGVTESLPIYSGGLGILAGDHLKAASELGVPLVGVGLLYQQGYFRQYLTIDGWQQEASVSHDFSTLPLRLERDPHGRPVVVKVGFPDRLVTAQVWRAQVGRVPLYLLDANVAENRPEDRAITGQLYGGDTEMRLKQEILLGIGGVRALDALGQRPSVCHLNEGHAAFAALERVRLIMAEQGVGFAEALEAASASHVFTTHTPVAAGHDYFPPDMVERYFGEYWPSLGLCGSEFLALGRRNPHNDGEPFCMTVLAMRLSARRNAVSRLHGQVTRRMWRDLWPQVADNQIPITSVTNGVHLRSWISHDMNQLYDRYLGPRWRESSTETAVWERVDTIPAEELWRTHERRRERLVAFARRRLRSHLQLQGAPPLEVASADEILDPDALTIGFARRFATYKRATLLLRDPERLAAVLNRDGRPVQVIFAGKAHPHDEFGKELIRQIVHLCREERFRRRIVFLEDYDMTVSRYLVQGADVWLNTPRRLREASGTSGMKAAANGALNVSVLDGWWDEAYSPGVGWAIGRGELYGDERTQDEIESCVLYDLLERDVVPLFYDRGRDGLPRGWITRMKAAISTLCPAFTADRMVQEYFEHSYLPSLQQWNELSDARLAPARSLVAWKARLREQWSGVKVETVERLGHDEVQVGATVVVRAMVRLGGLTPDDVRTELHWGRLNAVGAIGAPAVTEMTASEVAPDGAVIYTGEIAARASGRHGVTVCVLPRHPDLRTPWDMGLVTWAS